MHRVCVVLVIAFGVSAFGPAADAAPAKKAHAPTMAAASLAKLKSDDPAEIRGGLDDARLLGPGAGAAAAVPLIAALLRSGLPYPLTETALDTLADIESPEGTAPVVPYAKHRDVKVRRAAVRALTRAVGKDAVPVAATALRAALSDPDAQVRATAATGLGSLKAKVAVLDLFLALDRHVYEAAVSIGQLCDVSECDALVGRLGKIPFDVVTTGLDQILFRPSTEVSDDVKVSIIDRVRDLGTRDANKFLRGILGRWGKTSSAKVRGELDAAVLATMSSPGSDQ